MTFLSRLFPLLVLLLPIFVDLFGLRSQCSLPCFAVLLDEAPEVTILSVEDGGFLIRLRSQCRDLVLRLVPRFVRHVCDINHGGHLPLLVVQLQFELGVHLRET